ncbi:MAG: hypothetical protein KC431_04910 [Myxococcales bacterium]|nr:hypothetical protein [Myxococcales bacterium]
MAISYTVTCGSLRLSSEGPDARPLLALRSEVGAGGAGGRCEIKLGDPSWGDPALGDAVEVELDAGDGSSVIFTGEVDRVDRRAGLAGGQWIRCADALAKLARVEVQGVYEEVSAGFIVKDLLDQAGTSANAGDIEEGPTLPSYVVHRGPRALRHVERIATMIGGELSGDGAGKIHLRRPQSGAAEHRLVWSEDLLAVELRRSEAPVDSFVVWGEGAAAAQGPERGHWLVTDLSGVKGEAGVAPGAPGQSGTVTPGSSGERLRTVIDGAVRSAETAGDLASARASLVALRPLRGHALALGNPAIQPGSWIELADLPGGGPGSAPVLRALRVIHSFDIERGLLTRVEF